MIYAPITLFVYNRVDHTEQTINALLKNKEAAKSELFIYSDAAKNIEQEPAVESVRKYICEIKGFKKITIVEQESNLGLSASIINGVSSIVNQFGKIIVLEDDLIVGPYFLDFMNRSLERYAYEESVACIHGYIYPVDVELPEVFFLKGADCWGWATWKRAWDIFEDDGTKLQRALQQKNVVSDFDYDGAYPYYQMLLNQIKGLNQSWAVRWYASAFVKEMFTLYPGKSLVYNIGLDSSGTHCSDTDIYSTELSAAQVSNVETKIENSVLAREAFKRFFISSRLQINNTTFFNTLKLKLNRFIILHFKIQKNQ